MRASISSLLEDGPNVATIFVLRKVNLFTFLLKNTIRNYTLLSLLDFAYWIATPKGSQSPVLKNKMGLNAPF
jgi:hypothetical protein